MTTLKNLTYTLKQAIVTTVCNYPKVVLLAGFLLLIGPGFFSLIG